jgi:hypothetical protein
VDYDAFRSVLQALEREQVRYVVFGAGAMNLLGLARFTEDLDIFVAPTEENVVRLRTALRQVFDDPSIDEITAADLRGDYPAVQYISVEAMSAPTWRASGDPELVRVIETLWTSGLRLQGARFPPGVHRYRSIEELDAQVQRWHQAHVDRRQQRRPSTDAP